MSINHPKEETFFFPTVPIIPDLWQNKSPDSYESGLQSVYCQLWLTYRIESGAFSYFFPIVKASFQRIGRTTLGILACVLSWKTPSKWINISTSCMSIFEPPSIRSQLAWKDSVSPFFKVNLRSSKITLKSFCWSAINYHPFKERVNHRKRG